MSATVFITCPLCGVDVHVPGESMRIFDVHPELLPVAWWRCPACLIPAVIRPEPERACAIVTAGAQWSSWHLTQSTKATLKCDTCRLVAAVPAVDLTVMVSMSRRGNGPLYELWWDCPHCSTEQSLDVPSQLQHVLFEMAERGATWLNWMHASDDEIDALMEMREQLRQASEVERTTSDARLWLAAQ